MVQFKQPCDIIALLSFFVCVFFFIFSSTTGRFLNLSYHLFSYPFCSKQTSTFTKIIFWGFSPKIRRGKKSFVLALSLCRSRKVLGYICRSIKGSQLTPHVQVRLTFLTLYYSYLSIQANFMSAKCCL